MTEKETAKKITPPYLPYKTLRTFIESMKVAVPNRIDRSLMSSMSGTMQSQLIGALEYLHLINPNGVPTEKLTRFIHSEGAERQKLLKEILALSYPFLFKEGYDIKGATLHELQGLFTQAGTTGDTTRKCIAFFMRAAKDAGIMLSPYIKKTVGRPRGSVGKIKYKPDQPQGKPTNSNNITPFVGDEISLEKLLLSKFPSFDPAWPDDVKVKWFEGFKDLMAQFKKQPE